MKTEFDEDWLEWINTNVNNGQDKNGIFKILLDEGYAFEAIERVMNFRPTVPVDQLINPFKRAASPQQTVNNQNLQTAANHGAPTDPRKIFIPNALKLNSDKLEMYALGEFLTTEECERIIANIRSKLRPSELSSQESDKTYRTSRTCDLGTIDDPFIHYVDSRICKLVGIDPSYSEVIQGQLYEVGQEFKAHTDYFEIKEMPEHGAVMGQRTYTVMIYLNDVEEGGETDFPAADGAIKPRAGLALIWNSLRSNGAPNPHSMHQAYPVLKGYKAVITKWFRSQSRLPNAPPMYSKEANEYIPNYTASGLHKSTLNPALFQKLTQFYTDNKQQLTEEHVPGDFIENASKTRKKSSSLIDLSDELRQAVHDELKPKMEALCNQPLAPTYVYGIREYHRGAKLKMHRDRLETHIISAIINIAQNVDEDWPLVIEDNAYRVHHILLKPGEVVFYEGGRLLHYRPIPFNGNSFANIFCHFKPEG